MKLAYIASFVALCLLVLGGFLFVHPQEGISLTADAALAYPTFDEIFGQQTEEEQEQIEAIQDIVQEEVVDIEELEEMNEEERLALELAMQDSLRRWQLKLHYPPGDSTVLYPFFDALRTANSGKKPIRVIHFGDSQIEGDRITGFFRNKLQTKFGGSGCGMQPAYPLVRSRSIKQENSKEWKRFTLYGRRDTLVDHKRYGMMANFGRFAPLLTDSTYSDTANYRGTITFTRSSIGFAKARYFSKVVMNYSHNTKPVRVAVYADGVKKDSTTLAPNSSFKSYSLYFKSAPKELKYKFYGHDSPDIYGFSFESSRGVVVDNVAMRGSSGTLFRQMSSSVLRPMIQQFDTRLIIMEYGGNVVPYMNSEKKLEYYGKNFERNIRHLKTMAPEAAIIVIGPSDMAHKVKTEWETYEHLEALRDRLKQATFEAGGAYWDMFEAMGGEGSMPIWVATDPPLAAKDHIHFNHRGAKKVAQWFYNAIVRDYNEYLISEAGDNADILSDSLQLDDVEDIQWPVDSSKIDSLPLAEPKE